MAKLGNAAILTPLINGYIEGRQITKFILLVTGLFLTILAVANPQQKDASVTISRKGIDIMYALDVSKSMLATDIAPTRLDRAKQLIKKSLDKMRDNRVGLVVFAGNAYLQVPLTVDYNALKMYLDNVHPDMIPQQGTVLKEALELSEESFSRKEQKFKTIFVISDGEDHDEEAVAFAENIQKTGTIINTIGVGSANGTVLIDSKTNEQKLDNEGNPVISKLNETVLKEIAKATKGSYFLLNNINTGSDNIIGIVNGMEKTDLGNEELTAYKSYFHYLILLAIIAIVLGLLLPSAYKNKVL